ncbi:Cu(I)-responsive transcriptional regulator [Paenalcaligenes suwonensis]|uniref:Cu(I)-responsive transcriptional regulator n=1 Tax=Paenalcaligenes suwonensis TaxID=1202713 RepID=UPI0014093B23|nr:Cu(I)-responsive transcriptional regulator [Paenalcaligenes suwonensis]NHC62453.1 Cu(I)-responsive transcriptional regulator [Paenalcaligenes suwonensis]
MTQAVTIGVAAERSQLSSKMIRYYESEGLLQPTARSEAGYRLYTERDLHGLRFIQRARSLGFSLAQIKDLLTLWHNQDRSSAEVKLLAQQHIDELERKAAELQDMANTLKHLTQCCHGDERPECPILDNLGAVAAN